MANKEAVKRYRHEYYLKHKKDSSLQSQEWYTNHLDGKKLSSRKERRARKDEWYTYFKEIGKNKCFICGYQKCWAAIDFHHINPEEKDIGIAKLIDRRMTREYQKELEKCIPLCRNCHSELHRRLYLERTKQTEWQMI